jgi:ribonuclease D
VPDPFEVIDSDSALRSLGREIAKAPYLAVDTESNSMHAYTEQVCWVQIETLGRTWLIDTVVVRDLAPLRPGFENPATLKILHGADYDVLCLRRDFDLRIRNLFDTSVAAALLGYPELGLAALVARHQGVTLDKSLTRLDWRARPLPARALEYLAGDVRYLHPLCATIAQDLHARKLVEEAEIEFARIAALEPRAMPSREPEAWRRLPGSRELDRAGQSVLRRLWDWREAEARARDIPPFKVLAPHVLLILAQRRPGSEEALGRIRALPPGVRERHGQALLHAVAEGLAGRDSPPPPRAAGPRPSDRTRRIDRDLREWRRREVASSGLTPLAVLPNHVLEAIAARDPRTLAELAAIPGLGEARLARSGAAILAVLGGTRRRQDGG